MLFRRTDTRNVPLGQWLARHRAARSSEGSVSFRTENDLNSFPLREMRRHRPCSIRTTQRNPSHLISKSQSGWLNGRGLRPRAIVWKVGSTFISIKIRVVRRDKSPILFTTILVSIHAPVWGATPRYSKTRRQLRSFNSRTRVGCDP